MERGHAHADRGVGEIDVWQMQSRDTGHKAGAPDVLGRNVGAFTQYTPADAVDELNLLVEGHLMQHEIGARVGIEGGIHPWLLRGVWCGGGGAPLCHSRGTGEEKERRENPSGNGAHLVRAFWGVPPISFDQDLKIKRFSCKILI